MSLKKDIIAAEVQIGTNQAQAELTELAKSTAKYRDENDRLKLTMTKLEVQGKKNSVEWKKARDQLKANKVAIKENELRMHSYQKKLGLTSLTIGQLRNETFRLRALLNKTVPNTPAWHKYNRELQRTQTRMRTLQSGTRKTSGFMGKLSKSAGALLPAFGFAFILTGVGRLLKGLWNINERLEAVNHKARIVFGDAFGYMVEAANENAKKLQLTVSKYIEAAAGVADLLVPIQFTREESAKMSKQLVELSGALSEWSRGQYDASEASYIATKALLGETEQMKQMGIVIDQSSKEYNKRIKLLMESQHYTKEQARALDIMRQITEKSTDAQASFNKEGLKFLRSRRSWSTFWQQTKEDVSDWAGGIAKRLLYTGDQIKLFFRGLHVWANKNLKFLGISYDVKPLEEYGAAILYGTKNMQYLTDVVEKFGTSSKKGKTALAIMRRELEATYGAEGIKILEDYQAEQEQITKNREDAANKERESIVKQRNERVKAAANTEALEALDLANKQRILQLKEQYGAEETMQKFLQARLLANELAYLQAKANLETDNEKQLALQIQIVDKQNAYNKAISAAIDPLRLKKEAVEELNQKLLEEGKLTQRNAEIAAKAASDQEELNAKLTTQANMYLDTIDVISQGMFDMMSGSEDAFKNFAKNILIFALEQLKVQAQLAAAGATMASLAQPDSIATFGISGLARAAIIVGLIEAAFAGLEGLVSGAFSGKKQGGYADNYASDDTVAGVYHANEFIASAPAVRNPAIKRVLDIIDLAQRNGTVATLNLPAVIGAGKQTGGYANSSVSSIPTSGGVPEGRGGTGLDIDKFDKAVNKMMQWEPEIVITDVKKRLDRLESINAQSKLN